MNGEYQVVVTQGIAHTDTVSFVFTHLNDATEFAGTCLECGKDGTIVKISRIEED